MYYFDTETCGLHGPTVLIQYAKDDSEINLHSVFYEPIKDTLDLIETLTYEGVIGFNLSFDWFHLCQTYTTLELLDPNAYPIDIVEEYAIKEKEGKTYISAMLLIKQNKNKYFWGQGEKSL